MTTSFSWAALPSAILDALWEDFYEPSAETDGVSRSDLPDLLAADYGPRPRDDFARDAWFTLLDVWLPDDADARQAIVDAVWKPYMGDRPTNKAAQLDLLLDRNVSKSLRAAVCEQVIQAGSPDGSTAKGPVVATDTAPAPQMTRAAPRRSATTSKTTADPLNLEATLWKAADKLRGKMDAAVYKHVVLGLIFLKYVSDTFMVRHDELARLVDDPASDYFMPTDAAKRSVLEDRDEYTAEGVFWIPEGHRWDDLRKAAKQPDIGQQVDAAMEAIERENPMLRGVLPKSYTQRELAPEAIGGLIDTFSRQDLASEEFKDLDVLGRVYEYFLGQFASKEGKKAGEFYTPRSIVQLLVEMLQPYHGRVLDPACGSGGMFVQADKFVRAHGGTRNDLSVFGQESNPTTWRLAKMNLAVRGIEGNLGPEWGDSFHADAHPDLKADFVLANPPFNDSDWGGERLRHDVRWKYGVPPVQNANYAWLQHFLFHCAPTGTVGTVLANGSLSSQQNGEGEIRKAMVEADVVECIVALPPQLFYGTQIPVCLWFLTKNKAGVSNGTTTRARQGETLFIDARSLGFMETRTLRAFAEADILKIADSYHAWRGSQTSEGQDYCDVPGFCRAVTTTEIAEHGWLP